MSMKNPLKSHTTEFLLAGMFILTYIPTLLWLWDRWFARDSYYSHGILIPFVSGFLVWQMRDELAAIKPRRSPWGMPLIITGLCVHLMSSLLRVYFTSGFSMLVVLSGLVLFFYGSKTLKKITFPVAFLIFMIPVPLVVITNISFKMKIFAAQIATAALNSMGLEAVRSGSVLKMQHTYVVVDDICSGLRSLISLTALGSIFAWWMKGPMPKRILLFCSTIPIAIATNVLRIVFLSFVSEVWGSQYATGFVHDFSGFMVFALAFVLLYAVGKVLE
ncbi:MAG TPA: exosortase A [Candidatus Omnitrophica bacterium]|nr:exosortase A [Candidatus Omnitrophota bacterium]HCI45048.1 exosortase A [Candidatus Omnitrophota bacterium]